MKKPILLAFFFYAILAMAQPAHAGESEQAAIFEGVMLTDLEGAEVALDSLLDRGPLVVNFWATWCSPCRLEMPHLEKIYREFAPKGVQFAAVSVDRKSHAGRVKSFMEKQEVAVPAYLDYNTALAKGFKVRAIPTTIIILQDRSLYHRNQGYRPGDEVVLRKHLQSLVEAAGGGAEAASPGTAEGEGGGGPGGSGPAGSTVETESEPPPQAGE